MSIQTAAARWPRDSAPEEVAAAAEADVIHARASDEDPMTLCERDGGVVPYPSVALVLTRPGAAAERGNVTCSSCVEWMHA